MKINKNKKKMNNYVYTEDDLKILKDEGLTPDLLEDRTDGEIESILAFIRHINESNNREISPEIKEDPTNNVFKRKKRLL